MTDSPKLADAWQLRRDGQRDAAVALATTIAQREPANTGALRLLAALASEAGDRQAAARHLAQAALTGPSADLLTELGEAHLASNDLIAAVDSFRRALALRPRNPTALRGLAQSHQLTGNPTEALAAFQAALAVLPYDKYAAHMVAALSGGNDAASANYIADLFDTYAETFDSHLTGTLGYRTPGSIRDLVTPYAPASLLDLGCGTGLVGAALHDLVPTIDGIDISAQMIRKARDRNIYRHLRVGDATAILATDFNLAGPYDLVAAGDVFVYFGDLSPVFAATARVLAAGGLFVFSVEAAQDQDYVLRTSGRHAHSAGYIEGLAADHGFVALERHDMTLRHERDQPVLGMLYLLRAAQ